jgi:hypothetical protein
MMSGAAIAGVARAAASHALERAVVDFSEQLAEETETSKHPSLECLVTMEDFQLAVDDVYASTGESDWEEEVDDESEEDRVIEDESTPESPDLL